MDLSLDVVEKLVDIFNIALFNTFLSAAHTIIAKLLGHLFSFLLGYVLSPTQFIITPAMCVHGLLFCCMAGTLEWSEATWTLITRDEPPAGLPGPEVANVATKGLLLVLYIIDVLFWNYLVTILSAVWSHFVLLLCLGFGTLFLLSGMTLLLLGGIERHQEESTFALSLRLLLTMLVRAGISAQKFCWIALQQCISFNVYPLEAWRPRPKQYRQHSPRDIYIYKDLDTCKKEIRLIKLTKCPFMGVRSSLEHFSLEAAPEYEAISYTWGSPEKDHLVFLDRHWLPTTRNAYLIFQDRASCFRTRWLWIDAVCIDQDDNDEKNVQVGMMGEIYQSAERVIVWLGNEPVKPSEVVAAMFLLETLHYYILNYEHYKVKLDSMELTIGNHESWAALGRLLTNPYWQRTWIIQEIAKAQTVHMWYGGQYISWNAFIFVVLELESEPGNLLMVRELMQFKHDTKAIKIGVSQQSMIVNVREVITRGKRLSLQRALAITNRCIASNPLDKVFALGNLVQLTNIDEGTDIRPDYSLTLVQVYTRTARYLLSQNLGFTLLQRGIGYEQKNPGLPTWVPDWSTSQPVDSTQATGYQAGGPTRLQSSTFILSTDLLKLSLRAISITKIQRLSTKAYSFDDSSFDIKAFQSFYQSARSTAFGHLPDNHLYTPTNQSLTEAFWRTLIGDQIPIQSKGLVTGGRTIGYQWPAPSVYGEYFQIWWTALQEPRVYPSTEETLRVRNAGFAYSRAIAGACSENRRLAVTEDGMMAIVPPLTEVGDEICVVGGAPKPVLLRVEEAESSVEEYKLVGDCYVHGIMNGEMWDGRKMARTFTIY